MRRIIRLYSLTIHWYNTERFQGKLNNRTPIEFRCAA
ncbi:IS3 family transposase [Clostridium perfringens]